MMHRHDHKMRGDHESLPSLIETMHDSIGIGSEYSSIVDSVMDDETLLSMIDADDSFLGVNGKNASRYTETKRSPSSSGDPTAARRRLERLLVDQAVGKSDARSRESTGEQLERLVNEGRIPDASRHGILDMLAMAQRLEENCTLRSSARYDDQDVGNTQRLRQNYAQDPSLRSDVSTTERYEKKVGIDPDGTIGTDSKVMNRNKNCRSSNNTFRSNSDSGTMFHGKQKKPQHKYQQERLSQSESGAELFYQGQKRREDDAWRFSHYARQDPKSEKCPSTLRRGPDVQSQNHNNYRRDRQAEPTGKLENSDECSPNTTKYMTNNAQHGESMRGSPKSRSQVPGRGQAIQSENISEEYTHQRRRNNSANSSRHNSSGGYKIQPHIQPQQQRGSNDAGSTTGGQKISFYHRFFPGTRKSNSTILSRQTHASSSRSIKSDRSYKSNRSSISKHSVPSISASSTRSRRLTSSSFSSKKSRQSHASSKKCISTSGSFDEISSCSSGSISQRSDEDSDCDYNSNDSTSIVEVLSVAEAVQSLNEHNKVERMTAAANSLRGKIRSKFLSSQLS